MKKIIIINELAFPLIFLSYGFVEALNNPNISYYIFDALIAAIFLCVGYLFRNKPIVFFLPLSFLFLILLLNIYSIENSLIFFFPLLIYPIFCKLNYYKQALLLILAIGLSLYKYSYGNSFTLILFIIIAVLSGNSTFYLNELINQFIDYKIITEENTRNLKDINILKEQQLNSSINEAILNERNRIAQDMHDSVGHLTSRAILQLGAMLVSEQNLNRREALLDLKATLDSGMTEIRSALHNLKTSSIDLDKSIQEIIFSQSTFKAKYKYSIQKDLSLNCKATILMIIKEAFNNIVKHSNSKDFDLSLIEINNNIFIHIQNDSVKSPTNTMGIGLMSIKDRVDYLGGALEISQAKGFTLFITIPLGENYENSNN